VANQIDLQIPIELDGSRIDKALSVLFDISRSRTRELLDLGVTVDGLEAKPGDRVKAGAHVVSPRPEVDVEMVAEEVDYGVLFEDHDIVVVDKPSGVVVHPGSGQSRGTLAAGLLFRYPELHGVGEEGRWGLVHRLDKDTSGVLIVARTPSSFETLSADLRRRAIRRVYTALVDGIPSAPTGTIEAPIGRDSSSPTRRAVTAGGKHARTHFEVDTVYRDADCSLLSVKLETGRTHQIRVHMSAIGHPVIGDRTYGRMLSRVRAPRIFLHASQVGFTHPVGGQQIEIASPLPGDLLDVLVAAEAMSPNS
jgi:23S rRNA pseudouridine1911/1915/1917 synthase